MKFSLLATAATLVIITSSAIAADTSQFGYISQLQFEDINVPIIPITDTNGNNTGLYATHQFKIGRCDAHISYFPNEAVNKYRAFVKHDSATGSGYTLNNHSNLDATIKELESSCGSKPKPYIGQIINSDKTSDFRWNPWIGYAKAGETAWKAEGIITGGCNPQDISYNVYYCPNGYSAASMYLGGSRPTDCQQDFNSLIRLMNERCGEIR